MLYTTNMVSVVNLGLGLAYPYKSYKVCWHVYIRVKLKVQPHKAANVTVDSCFYTSAITISPLTAN